MSDSAISRTAQYLTFRLGDEIFAVNVFKTREALDLGPITKVPQSPDYMRGVVNVRGSAIPVADLRLKFGITPAPDSLSTRIIVLEAEIDGGTVIVGGLADSVLEVIELEAKDIDPPPALGMKWRAGLVTGIGKKDGRFIMILDMDKVFSTEDKLALDGAGSASA
jgi:purine-binding chemotaxis protein CheW